jgi:hypothetical protein
MQLAKAALVSTTRDGATIQLLALYYLDPKTEILKSLKTMVV